MLPLTSPEIEFIDADDKPPPTDRKLLLLTRTGVAIIGKWDEGCIGWLPLPKIPAKLKANIGKQ